MASIPLGPAAALRLLIGVRMGLLAAGTGLLLLASTKAMAQPDFVGIIVRQGLVPMDAAPGDGPRVCLVGWTDVVGSPSFDVGQVMGDFLEVAALFGGGPGGVVPAVMEAAVALRSGYEKEAGRPMARGFWTQAGLAACVKVLDHDVRRIRAFGEATVPTTRLQEIAASLLDTSTPLGAVFA